MHIAVITEFHPNNFYQNHIALQLLDKSGPRIKIYTDEFIWKRLGCDEHYFISQ